MDNENDKKRAATTEPRPDWWWEIKRDRPWVIIHVEDGPPVQRATSSGKPTDDDDTYFQPRWAEEARLLGGPSTAVTEPGLGHRRPRPTFTEMKAKLLTMIHRDDDR